MNRHRFGSAFQAAVLSLGVITGGVTQLAMADAAQPASPATANPAPKLDKDTIREGYAVMRRSIEWLKNKQDPATGGWGIPADANAPKLPALTGLVINGMMLDPRAKGDDPEIASGVKFMLSLQQADGGIYDRNLQSYNTAICVSALSRVGTPDARAAAEKGVNFLRQLQWGEDAGAAATGDAKESAKVTREHPFYGGVGYGRGGRPDNSNLNFFLQAFQDAGVDCNDVAVQRAMVFLSRTQMLGEVNDQEFAKGSKQGGFIYATATDKNSIGRGESKGETIEETMDDGTKVSRLRAYGSMTYAGFKSLVYAKLPKDDVRVKAAYDWIQRNYTVEENPGAGHAGQYYYYVTFARAMHALGEPTITPIDGEGKPGEARSWQADLIKKLASMQNSDGSFKSVNERWMENNPELITAYAVIALGHALE